MFDLEPLIRRADFDSLIAAWDPGLIGGRRASVPALRRGPVLHRAGRGRTQSDTGFPRRCTSRCSPDAGDCEHGAGRWRRLPSRRHMDRGLLRCGRRPQRRRDRRRRSRSSRTRGCSSRGERTVGGFATNCCVRSRRRLAPPTVRDGTARQGGRRPRRRCGGDPDWRLVAAHYERAERFDKAAAAYQQASAAALNRGALAEARSYLTQALGQLDFAAPGP